MRSKEIKSERLRNILILQVKCVLPISFAIKHSDLKEIIVKYNYVYIAFSSRIVPILYNIEHGDIPACLKSYKCLKYKNKKTWKLLCGELTGELDLEQHKY